jgi:putative peptidoglycan lipid II flippase
MATSQALAGYAVGLPAFSAMRIAAQTFYALGDTRTPVRVGFLTVIVNVAFALLLMRPLRHAGLALASSLAAYASLLALYGLLRRRLGALGGAGLAVSLARTLAASVPLLLWCLWLQPGADGTWRSAAWTLGTLGGGVAIYAAAAALLRAPELTSLLGLLRRQAGNLPSAGGG